MSKAGKKLTSSLEDYLEAILDLAVDSEHAHVRDIAKRLGVGKPAVTAALKVLASRKLVNYASYKPITLTKQGQVAAEVVRRRHDILKDFMINVMGLDEDSADSNACRVEHVIDSDFRERLGMFAEYIHNAPEKYQKWIADFAVFTKAPSDGSVMVASDTQSTQQTSLSLMMASKGDTVRLVDIRGGARIQHRLAEMGLTPGMKFDVITNNRGGPCVILVKGTRMMIGRGMIDKIFVTHD